MDESEEDRALRREENKLIMTRSQAAWRMLISGPSVWANLPPIERYLPDERKEFLRVTFDPSEPHSDGTPIDGMRLAVIQGAQFYAAALEKWARENGREDLVTPVKDLIQ